MAETNSSRVLSTNGYEILVDECDLDLVNSYGSWYVAKRPTRLYAVNMKWLGREDGKCKQKATYMHRIILPTDLDVDHINGNGIDNRRANLRAVTRSQNMRNRGATSASESGIRGVRWNKARRKWIAQIKNGKTTLGLGYFSNSHDAQVAWFKAALDMWEPDDLYVACLHAPTSILELLPSLRCILEERGPST